MLRMCVALDLTPSTMKKEGNRQVQRGDLSQYYPQIEFLNLTIDPFPNLTQSSLSKPILLFKFSVVFPLEGGIAWLASFGISKFISCSINDWK